MDDFEEHEMAELQPTPHAFLASTTFTTSDYNFTSNSSNNATGDYDAYYFFRPVQFPLLVVLLVAIVVGNVSVIVALLFTKARKSRMNFFIMQLAIADLLVGLIFVTSDIVQKVTITWYAGDVLCKLFKFLQGVVFYASTNVLVALSIDRCDAITNPMNFSGSWNRARALVASAWLLSILCSIPLLILPETKEVLGRTQCWIELDQSGWKIWMTTVAVTILVLPTLTIAACYTVIVLTIWTKSKAVVMSPPVASSRKLKSIKNGVLDGDPDSRRASSRGLIPRAKIKSVKMSFVIVFEFSEAFVYVFNTGIINSVLSTRAAANFLCVVFILCWSPYIVFDLLQVYQWIPSTQHMMAWATLIQSLAPLNSAANPLICCLFSPHIYTGLRRIPPYSWCCGARRRGLRGTLRSRSDSTAHSDLLSSTHVRRTQTAASMLNSVRISNVARSSESRRTRLHLASSPRD